MKYNHAVKVSCLTGLITLSLTAFSFAAAPADDSSKASDPAFSVPTVANPIPNEVVKDLEIVEDQGRWLVSDKALSRYGIKEADKSKGPIGSACQRRTTVRRPGRATPFS